MKNDAAVRERNMFEVNAKKLAINSNSKEFQKSSVLLRSLVAL